MERRSCSGWRAWFTLRYAIHTPPPWHSQACQHRLSYLWYKTHQAALNTAPWLFFTAQPGSKPSHFPPFKKYPPLPSELSHPSIMWALSGSRWVFISWLFIDALQEWWYSNLCFPQHCGPSHPCLLSLLLQSASHIAASPKVSAKVKKDNVKYAAWATSQISRAYQVRGVHELGCWFILSEFINLFIYISIDR